MPRSRSWGYFTFKLFLRKIGVLGKVSCKYPNRFWSYKENLFKVLYLHVYIRKAKMMLNVKNQFTWIMLTLHESVPLNESFSDIFRGYRNGTFVWNELKKFVSNCDEICCSGGFYL